MATKLLICSMAAAAAIIIMMLMIIAPSIWASSPAPEAKKQGTIEFLLGCLSRIDSENYYCVLAFREIVGRYMGTGRLNDEFVEALKILHNNNDTEVDFAVCNLDLSRCPPHIKARLPPIEWPEDDYDDDWYNYDFDGLPLK